MEIIRFYIKEWVSKNGNKVKAIYAVASDNSEHFIQYVK